MCESIVAKFDLGDNLEKNLSYGASADTDAHHGSTSMFEKSIHDVSTLQHMLKICLQGPSAYGPSEIVNYRWVESWRRTLTKPFLFFFECSMQRNCFRWRPIYMVFGYDHVIEAKKIAVLGTPVFHYHTALIKIFDSNVLDKLNGGPLHFFYHSVLETHEQVPTEYTYTS